MTSKRTVSASVQVNTTTLWILGGYNDSEQLDSSEFVQLDSAVGKPGPKLPYEVSHLCAVKYSEDKVYVIGGYDGLSSLNKVLIFNPMNNFTHIEGPPMITERDSHACGIMSNGQQSKIVVIGGSGQQPGQEALSSVEIFDPTVNNWIPGKEIFFAIEIKMKQKICSIYMQFEMYFFILIFCRAFIALWAYF